MVPAKVVGLFGFVGLFFFMGPILAVEKTDEIERDPEKLKYGMNNGSSPPLKKRFLQK